mgnify:CR=1 FL=1
MTLQKWEIFQDEATVFLNNYCNANFKMEGGFDSTTSHITARKANKVITTIEAKFASTQAGQIVLQKDGNKFYFCDKSKNDSNVYTDKIINYLNKNHSSFEGVKTASIHVNIDESILFSWVKTIYDDKDVEWIISSKKFNNLSVDDLLFVPINEIENYFDISIVFRRKKVGNTHIPGKDITHFKEEMDLLNEDYIIKKTNNKYLLTMNKRVSNFNIGERYLLSITNVDCQYYIKKKDINTNPNIMFQLNLKDNVDFKGEDFKEKYKI